MTRQTVGEAANVCNYIRGTGSGLWSTRLCHLMFMLEVICKVVVIHNWGKILFSVKQYLMMFMINKVTINWHIFQL